MRTSPRLWPVSAGLIGLTALAGCHDATVSQGPSERPVQVQRVTFTDADVSREFVGVVRAPVVEIRLAAVTDKEKIAEYWNRTPLLSLAEQSSNRNTEGRER